MNMVPEFQFLSTNFYPGFKVTNMVLENNDKNRELFIYLSPLSEPCRCTCCGGMHISTHAVREKRIRDASFLGCQVTLVITYRVIQCNDCGSYATEDIEFISERARVTKRLEEEVIDDLEKNGSIKDTARRTGLGWDLCKDLHKRYLQENISFDLKEAKFLAIDEFSIKKGHKYATVVVDVETRRVIWVGKGKAISDVNEFFRKCGTEGCKQIKAVAMDQNAGFASCVKKYCPQARVIYDLFHMIYNYGRLVVSAIRLRLASEHNGNGDEKPARVLKNSRFLLLTKLSGLSSERKVKLDELLARYKDLNAAHLLKELLPDVFKADSKSESEKLWDKCFEIAMSSDVKEITSFAANQNRRYRDGITNSGLYKLRTSVLEGINNKIKVLKRVAYGYRDTDYFFLRIQSAFRGRPAIN